MKKLKLLSLIFCFNYLYGINSNLQTNKVDKESIVGIWAMIPLRNGIANVVEFTKDRKSKLYPFNCSDNSTSEIEIFNYAIMDNGKKIHIVSKNENFYLNVESFVENSMKLSMDTEYDKLNFTYIKTKDISPLCFLYKQEKIDASKNLPFKESDFYQNPFIPYNQNIERYVGMWADENGIVQIEIIKENNGKYKIYQESDENWHHLYNDVFWLKDELHFTSFAYTNKKELFSHPYNKSKSKMIITPVDDVDKIKSSFFIDDRRFDYILIRKRTKQ